MRFQTTVMFAHKDEADLFSDWLKIHKGQSHNGMPLFINMRQVGNEAWCVEFSADDPFVKGVAAGIQRVFEVFGHLIVL